MASLYRFPLRARVVDPEDPFAPLYRFLYRFLYHFVILHSGMNVWLNDKSASHAMSRLDDAVRRVKSQVNRAS